MSQIVPIGATCKAHGHPTQCTETVNGTVQSTATTLLSIAGTDVATKATAVMHFGSHSHDYSIDLGCHQNSSHDIDPDDAKMSSILKVEGSPVYLKDTGVTNDPGSGGNVDIIDGNDIVRES